MKGGVGNFYINFSRQGHQISTSKMFKIQPIPPFILP